MHLLDPYFEISPAVLEKIASNQDTAPQFSLDHFTDDEAKKLVQAIINSTLMGTLYLFFTAKSSYTPSLIKFLRDLNQIPRPIGLNLQSVKLDNSCLEKLTEILASNKLQALTINNCAPPLDAMRSLLVSALRSSNLRELHIAKNNLGDQELNLISQSLSDNKSLQVLSFYQNSFTDEGVKFFAKSLINNESIHTIDLSFNTMQNATVIQLIDMLITRSVKSPIKTLSLANIKLSDAATDAICQLLEKTSIEKLDISGNFFSDTSLKRFHEVMRSNKYLKEFKLSGNQFFPGHTFSHNPDFKRYPDQKRLLDEIKEQTDVNKNSHLG